MRNATLEMARMKAMYDANTGPNLKQRLAQNAKASMAMSDGKSKKEILQERIKKNRSVAKRSANTLPKV